MSPEVKIPQNVDPEDKLIGPLTLKQFLELLFGFGLAYILFVIGLPTWLALILALPCALLGIAFAFLKVNGQPLEKFLGALISYYLKPSKRVWRPIPKTEEGEEKKEIILPKPPPPKKITRSRLEELAYVLDTQGKLPEEKEEAAGQPDVEELKADLIEKRAGMEEEVGYKGIEDLLKEAKMKERKPPEVKLPPSKEE